MPSVDALSRCLHNSNKQVAQRRHLCTSMHAHAPPPVFSCPCCVRSQGIVDVRDGDSLVVLNRRAVMRGQELPYDDQRLVMKAMVMGERASAEASSTPRQVLSEGAARTIIYHRCGAGNWAFAPVWG